jgi:hypothetical protein
MQSASRAPVTKRNAQDRQSKQLAQDEFWKAERDKEKKHLTEKTERLKALRLAKEASDIAEAEATGEPAPKKKKIVKAARPVTRTIPSKKMNPKAK